MQFYPSTFVRLKCTGIIASLLLVTTAFAQTKTSPAAPQTEAVPLRRRPVLSTIRGPETEFLKWFESTVQSVGNAFNEAPDSGNFRDKLTEGIERFLYESRDPSFIKINPSDRPDQVAWKIGLKKIVPRIMYCPSTSPGSGSVNFYVTQQTNHQIVIKADHFVLDLARVEHFHPTELERRNGVFPSSTYEIGVKFDPFRTYSLTNLTWGSWQERYNGGRLTIHIQEVFVEPGKTNGVPPFVVDVKDGFNFDHFDCSLLPTETQIVNVIPVADRIKHLELEDQIRLLNELHEQGDPEATRLLAERYRKGEGVATSYPKAIALYEELGRKDPTIFTKLASRIWKGEFGAADPANTVEFLKRAALGGDTKALCDYAICLRNGIGCRPDVANAILYFDKAAEAGDTKAQHIFGLLKVEQNPQDLDEAVRLLSLAVKRDPWAEYPLGLAYAYLLKERCPATWHFLAVKRDSWQPIPSELLTPIYQSMSEHFTKAVDMKDARAYPYFAFLATTNRGPAMVYAYASSKMTFDGRLIFTGNLPSTGQLPWFTRDSHIFINGDQAIKEALPAPNLYRLSFDDSRSGINASMNPCPKNLILVTSQTTHQDEQAPARILDPKYWGGGQDPNQSPNQPARRRTFKFTFP